MMPSVLQCCDWPARLRIYSLTYHHARRIRATVSRLTNEKFGSMFDQSNFFIIIFICTQILSNTKKYTSEQYSTMPRRGRKRKKTRTHAGDENAASSLASSEESKIPKSLVVNNHSVSHFCLLCPA